MSTGDSTCSDVAVTELHLADSRDPLLGFVCVSHLENLRVPEVSAGRRLLSEPRVRGGRRGGGGSDGITGC